LFPRIELLRSAAVASPPPEITPGDSRYVMAGRKRKTETERKHTDRVREQEKDRETERERERERERGILVCKINRQTDK
jgi:hypothetical protein